MAEFDNAQDSVDHAHGALLFVGLSHCSASFRCICSAAGRVYSFNTPSDGCPLLLLIPTPLTRSCPTQIAARLRVRVSAAHSLSLLRRHRYIHAQGMPFFRRVRETASEIARARCVRPSDSLYGRHGRTSQLACCDNRRAEGKGKGLSESLPGIHFIQL